VLRPIRIALSLSLGLFVVSPGARADASAEAEALIAKGVELREKGRDDEALAVFKEALAKAPSPRARAQVGLAEQALGMWVLAEADLFAALAAADDPWIAKNRAPLEGALAVVRRRLASLEVRGAENAEVFIDGVRIGKGVGPFRVEAGRRTLEVRAPGFHPTARTVELPAGGIARETVTLVAASHPEVGAAREGPRSDARDAPNRVDDPGRGQRLLGWGFVGGGAALVATGGAGLLVRNGIVEEYNATCPGVGVAQPPTCEEQVSAARTWLTVSIVTLAGGAVLAIGGVVLVASAPSRQEPNAARGAPRLACGLSGPGLGCAGTF
jgi:hypothetical protein